MAVAFTPPQGTRSPQSKRGAADPWARQYAPSGASPSGRADRSPQGQRSKSGQRKVPAAAEGDGWYRDAHREADEDKRWAMEDTEFKRTDEASLVTEVQQLRIELQKEKAETEKATQHFQDRIEHERRESTRMQMVTMKAQMNGSGSVEEASAVKRDVVDKTNEILEAMREIREQQQQAFKQVKSLSYAMLKACSQPTPGATGSTAGPVSSAGSDVGRGMVFVTGTRSPGRSPPRSPPSSVTGIELHGRPSPPGSLVGGRQRSPSEAGGRQRSLSLKTVPESEGGRRRLGQLGQAHRSPSGSPPLEEDGQRRWFKQMQANLEQFGDVEVFMEQGEQECMCCNQLIASHHRVRPRKCSHVFHIECLLHWWTEGTCPVCHVSFSPEEAPPEARLTERSTSTTAARRDAAYKQHQHRRFRSPGSNVSRASSPPSQPRNVPSDVGLRPSQSAEAFPQAQSPVRRSVSKEPQANPL